jgi:hypothetical protein
MSTQPEALALILADMLSSSKSYELHAPSAKELRRLYVVHKELLGVLKEIAYRLEGSRIWGGRDWHYNPIHPVWYLPLRDKARAAIAKAEGETK